MNQSLDGYVDFIAFAPSPTLFRHFIEEAQGQAGFASEIRNLSREDDVAGYGVQSSLGDPLMGKALVDPAPAPPGGLAGSLMSGVETLFNWVTSMVAETQFVDCTGDPPSVAYMPNRSAE